MTPCTGQSSPSAVDVLCSSFLWCDCCGALVISLFWFVVSLPFLLPAPVSFANTSLRHWSRGDVLLFFPALWLLWCLGSFLFLFPVSLPPFLLRRPFLQQLTQLEKNSLQQQHSHNQAKRKRKRSVPMQTFKPELKLTWNVKYERHNKQKHSK